MFCVSHWHLNIFTQIKSKGSCCKDLLLLFLHIKEQVPFVPLSFPFTFSLYKLLITLVVQSHLELN